MVSIRDRQLIDDSSEIASPRSVGSAVRAAIPQVTVIDTAAGAEGIFLFVEVRLESGLPLHRLLHERLSLTDCQRLILEIGHEVRCAHYYWRMFLLESD